jgi:hypothetical protein
MGTGIVALSLWLGGYRTVSAVFLAITAFAWIALGSLLASCAHRAPTAVRMMARSPLALTGVAATAVLGAGAGERGLLLTSAIALGVACALWVLLLVPTLGHLTTPTNGATLMLAVSTESIAALSAAVGEGEHAPWLVVLAMAALVLGVVLYVLVIRRFDPQELRTAPGDHWVAGGALAISTLACSRIVLAADRIHTYLGALPVLKIVTAGVWVATMAWLPALLFFEARSPRLHYDIRRWSTVFPVGMYAACSLTAARALHLTFATQLARVWVWVGVALWALVVTGAVREAALRDPDPVAGDIAREAALKNGKQTCDHRARRGSRL